MKGFKRKDLSVKYNTSGVNVNDRFKDGKPGGKETNEDYSINFLRIVAMSYLPLYPQCLAHKRLTNVCQKNE